MIGHDQLVRVFISHSHLDDDFGRRLAHDLGQAMGNDELVWYDSEGGLNPGDRWWSKIVAELTSREAFLVIVSPEAMKSRWVNDEIDLAWNQMNKTGSKLIIPILWQPCQLRADLELFQAISFVPPKSYEESFADLLRALRVPVNNDNNVQATTSGTRDADISSDAAIWQDAESPSAATLADIHELDLAHWFHKALDFFQDRLANAFPGVRGLRVYSGRNGMVRLARLLRDPLAISGVGGNSQPLWWWHGYSDMEIDCFQILDEASLRCLIGHDELLVDLVAVYRSPTRPYRSFVYVSARPDQPTGIDSIEPIYIEEQVQRYGFAAEEVGYWNDKYISREEYDDGHAEIDGEIVNVAGAKVRVRYLSSYNLFITSQTSVFNSVEADKTMTNLCNSLLTGQRTLEEVVEVVEGLNLSDRIWHHYNLLM